jgi:UPF0755 protein
MEVLMSETGSVRRLVLLAMSSLTVFTLIGGFLAAFGVWLFLRLPVGTPIEPTVIEIPAGANAMAISNLLHAEGVISDPQAFFWLCRFRSASSRLQAGEYAFSTPMTPDQVLEKLIRGRVVLHRVTIPEGSTIRDIALLLEDAGLARAAEIKSLARDNSFIESLGMKLPSLEGYLFPETYHFPKNQSARTILKGMVRQFMERFADEMNRRASEVRLSLHEVVILASIVEKEAAVDVERPLVAAVFLNRLSRNMPLQSDPTAVYDMEDFSGPITAAHLKRQSPYNTYQIKGLPIGPICNPGTRSLEAVLNPASVPYLYFVSNHDGTHHFSSTLSEHQDAVSLYREKVRKTAGNAMDSDASAMPDADWKPPETPVRNP